MSHQIQARAAELPTGMGRWFPECECGWTGTRRRTKKEAVAAGVIDHVERIKPQPPECPTPWKLRFKTKRKAEANLQLFWRTAGKGKQMPCRVYECVCGYWHTTKRPMRESRTA